MDRGKGKGGWGGWKGYGAPPPQQTPYPHRPTHQVPQYGKGYPAPAVPGKGYVPPPPPPTPAPNAPPQYLQGGYKGKGGHRGPRGIETLCAFDRSKEQLKLLDIWQRHGHHQIPPDLLRIHAHWCGRTTPDVPVFTDASHCTVADGKRTLQVGEPSVTVAPESGKDRVAVLLVSKDTASGSDAKVITSRIRLLTLQKPGQMTEYLPGGDIEESDGQGLEGWSAAAVRHIRHLINVDLSGRPFSHFADFEYKRGDARWTTHVLVPEVCKDQPLPAVKALMRYYVETAQVEEVREVVDDVDEEVTQAVSVDAGDGPDSKRRRIVTMSKFVQRKVPRTVKRTVSQSTCREEDVFKPRLTGLLQLSQSKGEADVGGFEAGACADMFLLLVARECGAVVLNRLRQLAEKKRRSDEAQREMKTALTQLAQCYKTKLEEVSVAVEEAGEGDTVEDVTQRRAAAEAELRAEHEEQERRIRAEQAESLWTEPEPVCPNVSAAPEELTLAFSIADSALVEGRVSGGFNRAKMDAVLGWTGACLAERELAELYSTVPKTRDLVHKYCDPLRGRE